jgi:SagB-type dehydrogenase family enzyme
MNATKLLKDRFDPKQLPSLPRLPPELHVSWFNAETVYIYGSVNEVRFQGRQVVKVLAIVLPLLRGRHSVAELTELAQPVPAKLVLNVLRELNSKGLLEECEVNYLGLDMQEARRYPDQVKIFGRLLSLSSLNRNRFEVWSKLNKSCITVVGSSCLTPVFISMLRNYGVINIRSHDKVATALADIADSDWIVCLQDKFQRDDLLEVNALAIKSGLALSVAVFDPQRSFSIPSITAGQSACYRCAEIFLGTTATPQVDERMSKWTSMETLSNMCISGLNLLTGLVFDNLTNTICFPSVEPDAARKPFFQLPRCDACGNPDHGRGLDMISVAPDHQENFAVLIHRNSHFLPREYSNKAYMEGFSKEKLDFVDMSYKRYVNHESIDVSVPGAPESFNCAYAETSLPSPMLLDGEDLRIKYLLKYAAGSVPESKSYFKMVTPSGGSLRSQTLYVVNDGIPGLPLGLSYYSWKGILQPIDASTRTEHLYPICGLKKAIPGCQFAIIHNANHGRLENKYKKGNALSYSFLDYGAMLTTMATVSESLHYDMLNVVEFADDALMDLVGNHTTTEIPLGVSFLFDGDR